MGGYAFAAYDFPGKNKLFCPFCWERWYSVYRRYYYGLMMSKIRRINSCSGELCQCVDFNFSGSPVLSNNVPISLRKRLDWWDTPGGFSSGYSAPILIPAALEVMRFSLTKYRAMTLYNLCWVLRKPLAFNLTEWQLLARRWLCLPVPARVFAFAGSFPVTVKVHVQGWRRSGAMVKEWVQHKLRISYYT